MFKKYDINPKWIATTKEKRELLNNKALEIIEENILVENDPELTKNIVFNFYTGKGGLHNLDFQEFDNYYDYSVAKKEFEMGQFLTPFNIAKKIVSIFKPGRKDKILELNVGTGIFLNFIDNLKNVFGFDIDREALKVAKYLYPDANLELKDMRDVSYNKYGYFNLAFGNPPFNLQLNYNGKNMLSQDIYIRKINELLIGGGLALFIVPYNWLNDEMYFKRNIEFLTGVFDLIGQFKITNTAFKDVGVNNFPTKLIILHKKTKNYDLNLPNKYTYSKDDIQDFNNIDQDKNIKYFKEEILGNNKNKKVYIELYRQNRLLLEYNDIEIYLKRNYYKLYLKYLNLTQDKRDKIKTMWEDLDKQEKPLYMDIKERNKKKITIPKILGRIKYYHYLNTHKPKKEIQLIHKKGKWIVKGYDNISNTIAKKYKPVYDMETINNPSIIGNYIKDIQKELKERGLDKEYKFIYPNYNSILKKKEKLYNTIKGQEGDNKTILDKNKKILENLDLGEFKFDKKTINGVEIDFSYQKEELIKNLHKPYYLINFEQGLGKTILGIAFMKAKGGRTLVVGPANAIKNTWCNILPKSNTPFKLLTTNDFLLRKNKSFFEEGTNFYLCTIDIFSKIYKYINKKDFKNIIIDEADEIKNFSSQRTKALLSRRNYFKNKVLMSGTFTRNNIHEIYPLLSFVFSNSYLLTNNVDTLYVYDKDAGKVKEIDNPDYGKPIPFKGGYSLFKKMFSPTEPTVFGVEKKTQSIYNKDALQDLIAGMSSRLNQEDILGYKPYDLIQVSVDLTKEEKKLYKIIIEEFHLVVQALELGKGTNNLRKKRMIEITEQIHNLLKSTSAPHLYPMYKGKVHAKAIKIKELINDNKNKKVMLGTNWIKSCEWYYNYIKKEFPDIKIFYIKDGSVSIKRRKEIVDQFSNYNGGAILLSTTGSLKSSINIGETDIVILESLMWNWAQISQYIFRAIRIDNPKPTTVYYLVTNTLEVNLVHLILSKIKLTSFINNGIIKKDEEIQKELGIGDNIGNLIEWVKQEDKKILSWKTDTDIIK